MFQVISASDAISDGYNTFAKPTMVAEVVTSNTSLNLFIFLALADTVTPSSAASLGKMPSSSLVNFHTFAEGVHCVG